MQHTANVLVDGNDEEWPCCVCWAHTLQCNNLDVCILHTHTHTHTRAVGCKYIPELESIYLSGLLPPLREWVVEKECGVITLIASETAKKKKSKIQNNKKEGNHGSV